MAEQPSSQLDTLETSVDFNPPENYHDHRASFHTAELAAARYVYSQLDIENRSKRAEVLDSCRTRAYFYRNEDTGNVKVISSCCRLRWCPICSQARQWLLLTSVKGWVSGIKHPKFLTLTLKHSNAPLSFQLEHLYASFRKFRTSKYFKDNVQGGVWFFQIKRSSDGDSWHPHLHCLIDSSFLSHSILSSTWLAITKTSSVVDIRAVRDHEKVAEYVSRYAAKPSQLAILEGKERLELVEALHGKRLVGTWGNAKGLSFRPVRPPDHDRWHNIGYYTYVAALYHTDVNAKKIFTAWLRQEPLEAGVNMNTVEDWMDNIKRCPQIMAFEGPKQCQFAFM